MNFSQFSQQFEKLKARIPRRPNRNFLCENSDLGNWLFDCKNAYLTFDTSRSKDTVYIFDSYKAINCVDGDYVIESENCYECIDVFRCYNCHYMNYCARMYDSYFCWDCSDSNNLFGCVHLKQKQYCIFNKQYKKDEYEEKIKELLCKAPDESLKRMSKLARQYPVTTTNVTNSENCDYCNHVHYSKNLYMCFDAAHSENSAYLYDSHHNKNCFDLDQSMHCESSYECSNVDYCNSCFYLANSSKMYDSGFCESCSNSNRLFGCVALDKKEYCLLNRQYTKEEYEKTVKEIMSSFREEHVN